MKNALLAIALLAGCTAFAADQPRFLNAKVEPQAGRNLDQAVRGTTGTAWIGYAEPVVAGNHDMCCYSNSGGARCCNGCGLEKSSGSTISNDSGCQQHLEPSKSFAVMIRVSQGQPQKVRMFSMNCPVDAGGMTVYWMEGISSAESVSYLKRLAETATTSQKDELIDGSIAAIAMHEDPNADNALANLMSAGHSEHVLEQAAFWAGSTRGSRGYEIIAGELARNDNPHFRKHTVFALSQNSDPRAQKKLIDMARHDSNSEIRSESLFWLAQEAGKKVAGVITAAIEDDPNTDVKKRAVFALSEMGNDEGIPLLIEQARKNKNPIVRKEAIFWLGQSNDQRAVDYIASVLEN